MDDFRKNRSISVFISPRVTLGPLYSTVRIGIVNKKIIRHVVLCLFSFCYLNAVSKMKIVSLDDPQNLFVQKRNTNNLSFVLSYSINFRSTDFCKQYSYITLCELTVYNPKPLHKQSIGPILNFVLENVRD